MCDCSLCKVRRGECEPYNAAEENKRIQRITKVEKKAPEATGDIEYHPHYKDADGDKFLKLMDAAGVLLKQYQAMTPAQQATWNKYKNRIGNA